MALLTCRYFSEVLGLSTTATVILPEHADGQIGIVGGRSQDQLPVLYLLHGMSDDDSVWTRRTALERYASQRQLAVVMPAAHRSFYTDQHSGYPYWTHIAEELPRVMASFFPLSPRRENTFVAGLSMGGYGALKLALRFPDRFCAAASLSGALDVANRPELHPEEWRRTFGSHELAKQRGDDLLDLARSADPAFTPALHVWCGLDDWLLDDSRAFRDICLARGIALDYSESDGDHDWAAWDAGIRRVLDWLPISMPSKETSEDSAC